MGLVPDHDLRFADLRGADLRRQRLEHRSLAGADLEGADLREASLQGVDLSNANLRGALLQGAHLRCVDTSYADLTGADLSHSHWSVCDLSNAHLPRADLRHAFLRDVVLRDADLRRADLSDARLLGSDCSGCRLVDALLDRTATAGSDFTDSDLTGARAFSRSRELVAEVLRRAAGDDIELQAVVAAVLIGRKRCWPEWRAWLTDHPAERAVALAVFDRYPRSGCREGLLGERSGDAVRPRRRPAEPEEEPAPVPPRGPDWDELAPVWELFEGDGLTPAHLAALGDLLRPPVLVVGAGRGLLVQALQEQFGGAGAFGVDGSLAMSRRARTDRGLTVVPADARSLPVPDGRFATVLCATGVLEYARDHAMKTILAEMVRACAPDGDVLITAASSDAYIDWAVPQRPFIDRWYEGRADPGSEVARRFDAVATVVGGRERARALLLRSLPPVGGAVAGERIEAAASELRLFQTPLRPIGGIGIWHLRRDCMPNQDHG